MSYTPTTEDVEFCYVGRGLDAGERSAGFYRWLAGVKAQAIEEAAIGLLTGTWPHESYVGVHGAARELRERANRLKEEA